MSHGFADPNAQMMKTGDGAFEYAYDAQAAASEDGVIVAAEVTTTVGDIGELVPMADQIKANTGELPGDVWRRMMALAPVAA